MFKIIRQRLYRISGKLLLKLDHLRQEVWEENLRALLGSVDPTTVLEHPLEIPNPLQVHFGRGARISWFGSFVAEAPVAATGIVPRIFIGDGTYIGNRIEIVASNKIAIGENVLVADDVYVNDSAPDSACAEQKIGGEIEIGDGSWIGENVSILGDVRIGTHCVVGANAVVRQNLPSFSVAVGSPARIIKRHNFATGRWEKTDAAGEFFENGVETAENKLPSTAFCAGSAGGNKLP